MGHMFPHENTDAGVAELHEMARRIGMKRSWFQNKPRHPHYDITSRPRAQAVKLGAIPLTFHQEGHVHMAETEFDVFDLAGRRLGSTRDASGLFFKHIEEIMYNGSKCYVVHGRCTDRRQRELVDRLRSARIPTIFDRRMPAAWAIIFEGTPDEWELP